MTTHVSRRAQALALAFLLAGTPTASASLIAVNYDSGELYSVSTADATLSLIGSTGLPARLTNLEFFDGSLYGFTSNTVVPTDPARLYRINLNDGHTAIDSITTVGELGLTTVFEGGLAIAPDGRAYGVNENSPTVPGLFSIDLSTGAATRIGTISGGSHDIGGLSWRSDGMLIGLDRSSKSLLVIDPSNAAATVLAPVVPAIGLIGGLVITEQVSYFATAGTGYPPSVQGSNGLYSFDPFTGEVVEFVGNFNLPIGGTQEGISGLAFIPEPSSVVLMLIGASALIRRRARRSI